MHESSNHFHILLVGQAIFWLPAVEYYSKVPNNLAVFWKKIFLNIFYYESKRNDQKERGLFI